MWLIWLASCQFGSWCGWFGNIMWFGSWCGWEDRIQHTTPHLFPICWHHSKSFTCQRKFLVVVVVVVDGDDVDDGADKH